MAQRLHRRRVKEALIRAGSDRALAFGWPNTYTYTKAMAEALLASRMPRLRVAVLRPAIVESAQIFPFPGWNEGFNTSGPLVYLAGTWVRHIPSKAHNRLDVIPVDHVCNALTIVAAALLQGRAQAAYHCGSSDLNPLSMERVFELSTLAHRRHLRKTGSTRMRRLLLSRWDIVPSQPDDVTSVTNIRRAVHQLTRFLRHGLPAKIPHEAREKADEIADTTETWERRMRQVEDLMELFQPFIHDHDLVFECRGLQRLPVHEEEFAFRPESIAWRDYWLDVHMVGLRRWCFPEYEGKERESYRAPHEVRLTAAAPPAKGERA
jgi:long-chain acyl-CoA synthetase